MKKKVKVSLYFLAGLVAVLLVASAIYFLLIFPLLEGKLKIYISMIWMYLCVFAYYWLIILEEEKIK